MKAPKKPVVSIDSKRRRGVVGGPYPPDPAGAMVPPPAIPQVCEDMAYRFLKGTRISSIRRVLNVGYDRAGEIVRYGIISRRAA